MLCARRKHTHTHRQRTRSHNLMHKQYMCIQCARLSAQGRECDAWRKNVRRTQNCLVFSSYFASLLSLLPSLFLSLSLLCGYTNERSLTYFPLLFSSFSFFSPFSLFFLFSVFLFLLHAYSNERSSTYFSDTRSANKQTPRVSNLSRKQRICMHATHTHTRTNTVSVKLVSADMPRPVHVVCVCVRKLLRS
jgi:hypothetical protein